MFSNERVAEIAAAAGNKCIRLNQALLVIKVNYIKLYTSLGFSKGISVVANLQKNVKFCF